MNTNIILASSSPRRRELLRQIGLTFSTDPADIDEGRLPGESPEESAVRIARDKARVTASRKAEGIVIGADTIVVLDDAVLGKPKDARDAERMLSMLSGRVHQVITGVAVIEAQSGRNAVRASITRVWFRKLSPQEIASYVAGGEPLDKAGAYGIQGKGALLVSKIEGCYSNVVGLPLALLAEMLTEFDVRLL